MFQYIGDRVWTKIRSWKETCFSAAGNEVIIKVVIQAIPSYAISCFKIPKYLVNELHQLEANFCWGSTKEKRKTHWGTWEKLCARKAVDGLGFQNLERFNKSLLAKIMWMVLRFSNYLASKVLKESYFFDYCILTSNGSYKASGIWNGILWGRKVIVTGSR